MRILLAVLLLLLLLLQYQLWLGEGGFANVRRLEQKVNEQAQENETLEQRNQELRAEVDDLRQGLEAIEERARSELGMIREDEEFYQVVPEAPGASPIQAPAEPPADAPVEAAPEAPAEVSGEVSDDGSGEEPVEPLPGPQSGPQADPEPEFESDPNE